MIVRATLPAPLERLRRRSVEDANVGMPAHLTLLYPFVEPMALEPSIREQLASIGRSHAPIDYRLVGRAAGFEFVPHLTIAEGAAIDDLSVVRSPAWDSLPATGRAEGIEVIAEDRGGRWRLRWRIRLGRGAPR